MKKLNWLIAFVVLAVVVAVQVSIAGQRGPQFIARAVPSDKVTRGTPTA